VFDVVGTTINLIGTAILFLMLFLGFRRMAADLVPAVEQKMEGKIDEVTETLSSYALTVEEKIESQIQSAIDGIAEIFSGILTEPTVKKAFSIIGTQGAEAKAEKGIVDTMATEIIDSKFGGLKMAASAIGIDIDGYIEEHGAIATIQALRQGGAMLGIDVDKILQDGMANLSVGPEANGANPYLK